MYARSWLSRRRRPGRGASEASEAEAVAVDADMDSLRRPELEDQHDGEPKAAEMNEVFARKNQVVRGICNGTAMGTGGEVLSSVYEGVIGGRDKGQQRPKGGRE